MRYFRDYIRNLIGSVIGSIRMYSDISVERKEGRLGKREKKERPGEGKGRRVNER